jgi:aerobic-type carbon monoxide dehydrogenase small subunit (CoxS/CutS family)
MPSFTQVAVRNNHPVRSKGIATFGSRRMRAQTGNDPMTPPWRTCIPSALAFLRNSETHWDREGAEDYHFCTGFENLCWGVPVASIQLSVNGRPLSVNADPESSLLTVLREHLDLTGTKYGCGEGQCGACTVLIDGRPQRSCVIRATSVAQKQITTIEGLARAEQLHPVQEAFLEEGAMQCAYCTPGMIMSAVALLQKNQHPTQSEIVDFMDGNICRCGTYSRIIRAIQRAAKGMGVSGKAKVRR